jgi:TRAP-type C4-dicarboxylate transport system permease small subunit
MSAWLTRLERAGMHAENALLVTLLTAMMGLALTQIVGRNIFDRSFLVGDEALRLMVLWLTLAGAMAASRADRHVNISLLDRMLQGRPLAMARVITQGFTAGVCGLLAWHSLAFVRTSHEYGDTLMGGLPAWALQAILPIGFGLMTWRHLVLALRSAVTAVSGKVDK